MNFLDDGDCLKGRYCIIEEHELEVLEGLDGVEIIDTAHDTEVTVLGTLGELSEVELIEASLLEGCSEHEVQQMHEINQNSGGNEKLMKVSETSIKVEFHEVEVTINTSTVEEVIFKKHRVEIIDKRSRTCIMEGIVVRYQLVGRVYDPDIVLEFEDGRNFYNENFGYLMRFYI